jgi:hypothetical protein
MDVFMSAVGWLLYDWQHRNMYVNNVTACILFGHLAPWQLIDIQCNATNPEFIQVTSFTEVKKLIGGVFLMFSILKHSTRIYNKQRCSVKHNIHIINILCIFREGLMMIPSESKHVAQGQ